jgi:hypothetical protein
MASAVDKDLAIGGSRSKLDNERGISRDAPALSSPSSHGLDRADDGDGDDDDLPQHMVSSTLSNSSVTAPPYWMHGNTHQRNISNVSTESILPAGAITLQDNETSEHNDRNNACWARSVEIVDYTVVNGGATSVGAFVVWNVRVETLNVGLVPFSSAMLGMFL